ncbi:DUF1003 domain-containing protein [Candidatus Saccharibacteria bacterium]|nr:DUF1003 domain-containing protein [Candidatus Saccharibacteria bacterium]
MPLIEQKKHVAHEPRNPNQIHRESLSVNEKIALKATEIFGSMPVFYLFFVWALLPLLPVMAHFQPTILYVSAGIIQLVALPLIIVGQNLQARHSEIRAEEEFRTTNSSYRDIEHILAHLDAQDEEILKQSKLLKQITDKLGIK